LLRLLLFLFFGFFLPICRIHPQRAI
jgi:hypothetical protein